MQSIMSQLTWTMCEGGKQVPDNMTDLVRVRGGASLCLPLLAKNFTWKRTEDMELYISVFTTGGSTQESKAPRPLCRNCRNYVVKWTRQGMARDLDQLNIFKVSPRIKCMFHIMIIFHLNRIMTDMN